jgi:flagellar hook-associated protein 1 FlgK
MSLNDILGSALSGLNAAQAALRSTSINIANVGTPGYARERVNLAPGVTAGQVSGVRVSEPTRVADQFLEFNVYRRSGDFGRTDVVANYSDRLQALLGAPGDESGLPARLDAIGAAAVAMTGPGATEQTVRSFTGTVQDALQSMQQLGKDVSVLRTDVESEVGGTVSTINDLLGRIQASNDTVSRQVALGQATGGATDLRMNAVEQLSGLIKVTVRQQPDGRLFIETAGGVTLVDKRARMLDYPTSGEGVDQASYPPIALHFVEADGSVGVATGERLDSPAIGGRLGGLLELRDKILPGFSEQLGTLFGGLAESLNAVSNAGSTVPPPTTLTGGNSGLVATDRLGFTGKAVFAVTQPDGTLVTSATVDFDALGASATIADAVAAINAGLGLAGSASFANGRLTIGASGGNGVVVAQDPANPSSRTGIGFAQAFGLNDLVTDPAGTLGPSGLAPSDPHGFRAGETIDVVIRDPAGKTVAWQTLSPVPGGTFADLLADLNGSTLAPFGSFAFDGRGSLRFTPNASIPTATVEIPADSSNRFGTGRSFSSLMHISGAASGLAGSAVRADILASAKRLPLARLNFAALAGQRALGAGDTRGANAFVDQLGRAVELGRAGTMRIDHFATELLGNAGLDAASAKATLADASARRDDAVSRRDSFSGVNIDEELAQLVVLQNSYSAAARVITSASQMYDVLIGMVH